VRMAAPPNMLGFVESLGLDAVAYGPDSAAQLQEETFRSAVKLRNPISALREGMEYMTRGWAEMSATLTSLADGADLILHDQTYQGVAANVVEYHDIPMAAMHHFPHRVNGQLIPLLPAPLVRFGMTVGDWGYWRMTKRAEDAQRHELGLPKTTVSSARRIVERGSLEIQTYEKLFFPGLTAEWNERRPFVGALTLELPTATDDEVMSWIAKGTPPIYFGFGSMPIESPTETIRMIGEACTRLGERALICAGANESHDLPHHQHVKVVRAVNHAAVFPSCRAVVHHGGAGTTAAAMRAGIPMVVLPIGAEQPVWATQVKLLKVGVARRFSSVTLQSLVADLRAILTPRYAARAREIATQMTKPEVSVTRTADLLEQEVAARQGI
jgi:UDP:flavonoid glycosyltransferase YjiC (YdhE family)